MRFKEIMENASVGGTSAGSIAPVESSLGIVLMLLIDIVLFGWWGVLIWGIQMIWIPFWAAGVINGIGHWWGYRNGETKDKSRNKNVSGRFKNSPGK